MPSNSDDLEVDDFVAFTKDVPRTPIKHGDTGKIVAVCGGGWYDVKTANRTRQVHKSYFVKVR